MSSDRPGAQGGVGRLAARAAVWMFGLNISNRVIGLVRTAIIARLLAPDDFGLFGIALLTHSVIEIFSMFGLTSALVRHPDDVSPYLDTAWVISFLRGLVVGGVIVLIAPLAASFFHQPAATDLIRLVALTSVFTGFYNPATVRLRRELRFGRVFLLSAVPGLLDVGVSIAIAAVYRTPFALVIGLVARAAAGLILSYIVIPYLPRVRLSWAKSRELLSYGKWITGSTILRFVHGQGDDIVVGRLLGAASLGLYQVGYKYSNLPTTEITRVLQTVALPAYAQVQEDPPRLRKAFVESLGMTALASMALAAYVWVIAPDFVGLVLGSRWEGVVPVMQILAIWGAMESVSEMPIALFEAVGRPSLGTRRILVKTLVLGALIYPMLRWWGLQGVCYAVLASSAPALVWSLVDGAKITGASVGQVLAMIAVPVVGGGLAAAGSMLLGLVLDHGTVWSLLARTGVCVLMYVAVVFAARSRGYTVTADFRRRVRASFTKQTRE